MNGYELSRCWFDWSFDNASKIKPVHSALFFFMIEHNNRLGWKKEFGLPRNMAMDAIGVKNNRTFTSAFNDLEEWGFIVVMERSKNQHSANIISLSASVKNTPATTKALDKAMLKHDQKQSTGTAPIDKHINQKQLNDELENIEVDEIRVFDLDGIYSVEELVKNYLKEDRILEAVIKNKDNGFKNVEHLTEMMKVFESELLEKGETVKQCKDFRTHFRNWHKNKIKLEGQEKKRVANSQRIVF